MPYEIETKELPLDKGSLRQQLEKVLLNMRCTELGSCGDSLTFKAKEKGPTRSCKSKRLWNKESKDISQIGKKHGMKFKRVGDWETMTVTYWRVK
jgi:hypothetical protein